ncbi:hypothetical protein KCTC52924_00064 [Arenibacter antarcticus]
MGIRLKSETVPATVSFVRFATDGCHYFKIPLPIRLGGKVNDGTQVRRPANFKKIIVLNFRDKGLRMGTYILLSRLLN